MPLIAITPELSIVVSPGTWNGHSYLLRRPAGNVLICCCAVTAEFAAIEQAGGIGILALTDIHFAKPFMGATCTRFDADLVCHGLDRAAVAKKTGAPRIETVTGAERAFGDDLVAIHTPGHAAGGLCWKWTSGGRTWLFTGDFLCPVDGAWTGFPMGGGPATWLASLVRVGREAVDVVLPGCTKGADVTHLEVAGSAWSTLLTSAAAKFGGLPGASKAKPPVPVSAQAPAPVPAAAPPTVAAKPMPAKLAPVVAAAKPTAKATAKPAAKASAKKLATTLPKAKAGTAKTTTAAKASGPKRRS